MEDIINPILQIKDVCISYTSSTMAVKHVTADIERNSITAIMGRALPKHPRDRRDTTQR